MREEYGTINGIDSYQRAVDKIENYNSKHGAKLADIAQTDAGETYVTNSTIGVMEPPTSW